MKIAYLASTVTLPGSPDRREDAYEHDHMMAALQGPFAEQGMSVSALAWNDPEADWASFDAAIIGTTWDYWNQQSRFLETLAQIEQTTRLFNPSALVRWNSHKSYLRDLEAKGVRTIPTLWMDRVSPVLADEAFETLGSDDLVFKRQIGANAEGQHRVKRGAPIPVMPKAMMVQPFLPMIQAEGEISFIFVDGQFCHALIKRVAEGEYRIQSSYGGIEQAITPSVIDLAVAQGVVDRLDNRPLYARIDMLRSDDGGLLLMEMELIEPYLYPLQGRELGPRLASAVKSRLKV